MFKNHLISIVRNLKRNKAYAAINISGLAIGFAAALLIGIFVSKEFTYDQHYKDHERIYRLSGQSFALSSIAHLNKVKAEVPGIEAVVNIMPNPSATLSLEQGESFVDEDLFYTTREYFDVFDHELVYGNKEDAFSQSNGLVLTETMARKLFEDQNPIGQRVSVATQISTDPYQVVAVIKDLPSNTSLRFSALALLPTSFEDRIKDSFSFTTGYSYFKANGSNQRDELASRINDLFTLADYERYGEGKSLEEFKENYRPSLLVMSLKDIHLESDVQFEASESGDKKYLYIFVSIAIFVILLAAINYINLSTAQASKRAKEIGIRSVLGSYRKQLIYRFLSESVFISLCALVVSLGLTEAALKGLQFSGLSNFNTNTFQHPSLLFMMLAIGLATGLIAGVYPALYLTRFKAATVLKGSFSAGERSKVFRNSLVVFQFVVSLSLAIFSLFAQEQLQYSLEKDLGFEKDAVIVVDNSKLQLGRDDEKTEPFRQELLKQASISSVSFSHYSMINQLPLTGITELIPDGEYKRIQYKYTDAEFIPTMQIRMVEGRNFDPSLDDERSVMVINESFAKQLGGDVLGRRFNAGVNGKEVEIVGVMEDFHYQNFSSAIGPVVFFYRIYASQINISFSGEAGAAVAAIQSAYAGVTDAPLDYYFFDKKFDQLFKKEQRLGQTIGLFTGLSIFVGVLGLIGLISYKLDQRIKEIGIRKVLGASVVQVLSLLSKEVIMLIGLALLISIPLSLYAVSNWMNEFVYHIQLSAFPFIIVAILAVMSILAIVVFRSYQAAVSNPIDALRNE